MIEKIYGENDGDMNTMESPQNNIENKFVKMVCEYVSDALNVSHRERRNFESLLYNILEKKINNRGTKFNNYNDGLLQQYEKYVLDKSSKRFIDEFNLSDDVKVNHNNATHAKFIDIIDKIKEKYENIKTDYNE